MGNYLITGTPGSGKSTVVQELTERGLSAYDADSYPDIVRLEIKATGKPAEWPPGKVDWDYFAWNLQEEGLRRCLGEATDTYMGVSASNQERFYHLFNAIFALVVTDEDLRERLETRDVHEFGQTQADIDRSVSINQQRTLRYTDAGAIPINNSQPINVVVDQILEVCHVNP